MAVTISRNGTSRFKRNTEAIPIRTSEYCVLALAIASYGGFSKNIEIIMGMVTKDWRQEVVELLKINNNDTSPVSSHKIAIRI